MRFGDSVCSRAARRMVQTAAPLLACRAALVSLCLIAASCGTDGPTTPDGRGGHYIATWSGRIVSEAIGEGTIVLSLASQTDTATTPYISGTSAVTFADSTFSASGPVVAVVTPGGVFGVTFDRRTVPCPAEPGGVAQRTMIASLVVTGNRMSGAYIAGGCPGGTMELTKP